MVVEKIISGGQTGADMGGLIAGKILKINTGGTAPPNWMTEEGAKPTLRSWGLTEGGPDPTGYTKRTKKNIIDSDGTLLMGNTSSPGSSLTKRLCLTLLKPYIVNPDPTSLKTWLEIFGIKVLNVAGNRESKNPGIQDKTIHLLKEVLGNDNT
ncbi:hypothetical protein LCGC14_1127640 [marine sediment metagenome]|uniref:Uncharacterized protein n=1 Tax=marine sediment metagenome TaxID=412755 RepID=A0A0F9Q7U6_9ZZZZ